MKFSPYPIGVLPLSQPVSLWSGLRQADRGLDAVTRASNGIPAGVRAQFPAQCASLASVPMPRLMREHAPGARAADERTYAAHVRSGAHAVQQQEATLRQLEGLANQEAQNARARCGRLVGQIAAEKQRLQPAETQSWAEWRTSYPYCTFSAQDCVSNRPHPGEEGSQPIPPRGGAVIKRSGRRRRSWRVLRPIG